MQGLGWQDVGRQVAGLVIKIWASRRLDLAVALTLQAAPPGSGVILSRVVRLVVAVGVGGRGAGSFVPS